MWSCFWCFHRVLNTSQLNPFGSRQKPRKESCFDQDLLSKQSFRRPSRCVPIESDGRQRTYFTSARASHPSRRRHPDQTTDRGWREKDTRNTDNSVFCCLSSNEIRLMKWRMCGCRSLIIVLVNRSISLGNANSTSVVVSLVEQLGRFYIQWGF